MLSSLALLKIGLHSNAGNSKEVMGILLGSTQGDSFIVVDTFPLPVEGSETRVNPQEEAYEFMIDFMETLQLSGRRFSAVGWYHSHPGYGCWLSGVDVSTQTTNQKFQDPFVAIVIDPIKTYHKGIISIGAFRTLPEDETLKNGNDRFQTVPLDKIEDFGAHANKYYELSLEYFKMTCDINVLNLALVKYWPNVLSSSKACLMDLSSDISETTRKLAQFSNSLIKGSGSSQHGKTSENRNDGA